MLKMVLAVLAVMLMVMPVWAERQTVTTVKEITVLGQPCAVVQTVDRGGPNGWGFFGTTRVSQTTLTKQGGNLVQLSQFGSQSDGLGKVALTGVPSAFALGGMQIIAAGAIRPDRNSSTVNVPVSVKGTSSAVQNQGQVGINAQAQGQLQGQAQGQIQGQAQAQAQRASGFTPPGQEDK